MTLHHCPQTLLLTLLGEDTAAHLEDTLETLSALEGVLAEAGDKLILNVVLDALPATTESGDTGRLLELRSAGSKGLVDYCLLNLDEVGPGNVLRYHGDCLRGGVDIGRLDNLARVHATKESFQPFGSGLLAGDEALSAEDAGGGVDLTGDGVDSDNVGALVVPWAVLAPVGGCYLLPGVVK